MSLFKTVTMSVASVTGSFTKGKWSQTTGTSTSFKGTFQPSGGKDLRSLPEGRRQSATYTVYSDLDFDTVTSSTNPDLILLENKTYEIVRALPWQNSVINHYKYLLQEKRSK